jgi:hypothetical protein
MGEFCRLQAIFYFFEQVDVVTMENKFVAIVDLASKISKQPAVWIEVENPAQTTLRQFFIEYLPSGGTKGEFELQPTALTARNGAESFLYSEKFANRSLAEIAKLLHSNTIHFSGIRLRVKY